MRIVRPTRIRSLRSIVAIALALLVATPEIALASEGTTAAKSLDRMSPQELERFVQQLNESANWRKYRRPNDPPDFVPGKPVRLMHGAGSSMRQGGGAGAGFRKSGLASRRGSRSGRGRNRDDAMSQSRSNSRSSRSSSSSSSNSRSRSSFGNSSRSSGSSSNSAFGNDGGGGAFDQ